MRLDVRGEYPGDWATIAQRVKDDAGWRCVRCGHAFDATTGAPLPCDDGCDPLRCKARLIAERGDGRRHCLTVHHLDGDKANCRWWNTPALCNSCHLSVQARVILERPYLFEHSEWFLPYVAGFYACYYGGEEITRAQAVAALPHWLALNPARPDATVQP